MSQPSKDPSPTALPPDTSGHPSPASARAGRSSSDLDLVRTYLEDISRHPLLSAQEEAELGRAIEDGREAAAELERGAGDTAALTARVEAADIARQRFVAANLRLVVYLARRYRGSGLTLLDLIQEGNVGLLRAVEGFDWRKGFRFSTYATWWIRQAISRGSATSSRTMRLPTHAAEALWRSRRDGPDLAAALGREPTFDELAQAMGISPQDLAAAQVADAGPSSLDRPLSQDSEFSLADVVACDRPGPEDRALTEGAVTSLHAAVNELDLAQRAVMVLRFGLDGKPPRSVRATAAELEITIGRVAALESAALAWLRHPANRHGVRALSSGT